jgi:hypothetical protein
MEVKMVKKLQKVLFLLLFSINFTQFSAVSAMKRNGLKKDSWFSRLQNFFSPSKKAKNEGTFIPSDLTCQATTNSNITSASSSSSGSSVPTQITNNSTTYSSSSSSSSSNSNTSPLNISSLPQGDGWRCGYFAAFNAFRLFKIIEGKTDLEVADLLEYLALDELNEEFQIFFDNLDHQENLEIKTLKQKHAWLSPNQIEDLLNILFLKPQYTTHNNISIIDTTSWPFNSNKTENYIIQNIKKFRENNIPQIIILVHEHHWTTHVFTQNTIWTANSLSGYQAGQLNNFLQKLHAYFKSEVIDLT